MFTVWYNSTNFNELVNNMLSKTTTNYAKKRDLDVSNHIINEDGVTNTIWIWEADNDSEPLFIYACNDDGSFAWHGNIYLADSIKEELPAFIRDEKHLREVLAFVAAELSKT